MGTAATASAAALAARFTAWDDPEPFTDVGALVELLTSLKSA